MKTLKEIQEIKQSAKSALVSEHEPDNSSVVDWLETVVMLCEQLESNNEDIKWLQALENAGIDNWQGIDYAKELLNEEE